MSSAAPQRVVIAGGGSQPEGGRLVLPPADPGWSLLGWVGLVFLAIGLLDLALGWFPPRFGNPEWEFGTVTRTFDSLPITVLGLALTLASAIQRRVAWATRAAAALCWLLALILAAGFVVFLLDVPVALKAVTQPVVRAGLDRAIIKALVQGVLYPTVLAAIGWQGVRATRRARSFA
jgi:hypothetical protein